MRQLLLVVAVSLLPACGQRQAVTTGTGSVQTIATSSGGTSSGNASSGSSTGAGRGSSSGSLSGSSSGVRPSAGSTTGYSCAGSPVFCDDFTDAALTANYTPFNGTWTRTVEPPQYAVTDSNAWERARATLALPASDFDLTIHGHTEADDGFGILYGASAAANDGYAVIVHPAQFQGVYLKHLNPGMADTDISDAGLPAGLAGTSMTLRVQRAGGIVTAWLNAQQLLQAQDDAGALDGRLGLLLSATEETDGGAIFTLLRVDAVSVPDAGTDAGSTSDAGSTPDAGAIPDAGGSAADAGTCTILGTIVSDAGIWETFTDALGQTPTANSWYIDYTHPLSDWVSDEQWELSQWTGSPWEGDTLILGVPLVLQGDDAGADFTAVANGDWDSILTGVFDVWSQAGYTDFFIRLDWEFNGNWMIWAITEQNLSAFLSASQHVAQLAHDYAAASIHVVWNPNVCNSANAYCTSIPYADYYYGDDYVDVVSVDIYGEPADTDTTDAVSQGPADLELTTALQFAQSHGKAFALSETGGMDTTFPANLAQAIVASGVPVQYVSIWDISNGSGDLLWSTTPSLETAWKSAFDSIQQASCAGQ